MTQGTIDDPYLGIYIFINAVPFTPCHPVFPAMTSQIPTATVTPDLIIRRKRHTLNNLITSIFALQGPGKFSGKVLVKLFFFSTMYLGVEFLEVMKHFNLFIFSKELQAVLE